MTEREQFFYDHDPSTDGLTPAGRRLEDAAILRRCAKEIGEVASRLQSSSEEQSNELYRYAAAILVLAGER